jgi:hypothetical protein
VTVGNPVSMRPFSEISRLERLRSLDKPAAQVRQKVHAHNAEVGSDSLAGQNGWSMRDDAKW